MKNLIISTVGTSLITNPASKDELNLLYKYSNCSENECPAEIISLIDSFFPQIVEKMKNSNFHKLRRMSAELNGILGFYNEDLYQKKNDMHFLVCTNTYQGKKAAEVVKEFLDANGLSCQIISPKTLSTKDKFSFSEGIKELLKVFDEFLESYKKNGYKIIFNLTGGFKSLQGYLNTIAMFYADKIIYIFESEQAELIEIPRLPITIDNQPFKFHKEKLLLLNANRIYSVNDFENFPETALDVIDDKVILSIWGEVIWNKVKYQLFDTPPTLPYLEYHKNFIESFNSLRDAKSKFKILETIAKVSVIVENSKGDTIGLSKGGIQFSPLESRSFEGKPVYHFRIDLGLRINCIKNGSNLKLIECGTHDQTQ